MPPLVNQLPIPCLTEQIVGNKNAPLHVSSSPSADLMRPAYKVHVVFVQELGHHVCTKREGDATVILSPAQHILVGVGPQQIAQKTLVGHVCGTHHTTNLLHRLQVRRESCR